VRAVPVELDLFVLAGDPEVGNERHTSPPSRWIAYYIFVRSGPRRFELLLGGSIAPHGDHLAGS
jgi:hypothetical protein